MWKNLSTALVKNPRLLAATIFIAILAIAIIVESVALRLAGRIARLEHDHWIVIFGEPGIPEHPETHSPVITSEGQGRKPPTGQQKDRH